MKGHPDQYLILVAAQVGDAKVFRCDGWTGLLLVFEELKDALERMGATGTRFKEV